MLKKSYFNILILMLTVFCISSCKTDKNNPPPINNTIQIKDNFFDPPTLTVTVGRTVLWRHVGTNQHTVTSGTPLVNPGAIFDSGTLSNGGGFTFIFNQKGTFQYFCRVHGVNMTGQVNVQ